MFCSDSQFKMNRIILKVLLIFACSGIIVCSTDEPILTDASDVISTTQKEASPTKLTKSTNLETSTTANEYIEQNDGSIDKNVNENSNFSTAVPSSEKKINDTSTVPAAESGSSTAASHEDKIISNSQTRASDIDYGGYFATNKKDSSDIGNELQKAGLQKSLDNEFIPLKSNEVEALEEKGAMPIDDNLSENMHTASVNITEPYSDNVNKSRSDDRLDDFSGGILKTTNINRRVSASPKSATIKRSLNSSGDATRDFSQAPSSVTFTSDSAATTASQSPNSKVDSSGTTIKVEELPTPLPVEIDKNSQFISHLATVESAESTSGSQSESADRDENTTLFAASANNSDKIYLEPFSTVKYNDKAETPTNSLEKEDNTESVTQEGSLIENRTKPDSLKPLAHPDVLEHESDDIIYAGFADDEPLGVTFDPDGMKNDFPQDPDSIIFSVEPKDKKQSPTETNADLMRTETENGATKPWSSEHSPHDAPETEFEHFTIVNASNDEAKEANRSEVPPAVIFSRPVSYSSEEMLQDAPQDALTHLPISGIETKTTSNEMKSVHSTESSNSNDSKEFIPHDTEPSVIRPVKIKSPSTSTQPTELVLSYNISSILKEVENVSSNLSSPNIQPNPAPSLMDKLDENPEISTAVVRPELVDSLSNKNMLPLENNETMVSDSTIAGLAIKTSVSVSLPISIKQNTSLDDQKANDVGSNIKTENSSDTSLFNDGKSSTVSYTSTSAPTTLPPSSSTTSFKIRKPSIRVPGMTDGPRTRKPFTPAKPRSSSTAGPHVSIFKKERTRMNSITSSTTSKPQFSTIRVHYASRYPGIKPEEFLVSVAPVTVPPATTTTTTEEPISEVPFTGTTFVPSLPSQDNVILVKVGGGITLERGLRWSDQLINKHSPEFKEKATQIHVHLENLFRSSPIAPRLWRIEIDGFNGTKNSRSVEVDFILYLIKSPENIVVEHLARVFHEKLSTNNTFARYRVDPSRTAFEMLQEEPLRQPTPPPEDEYEPPVPQWAIAVIVICAASLIFIVLFAAVTMYGRHHMRRRYGNKLNEDELDRSSGEWESKMTAAYENMAADTIYDAEDLRGDTYKKQSRIATFHGIPSTMKRSDSWSSGGWSTPPRRKRPPHVH